MGAREGECVCVCECVREGGVGCGVHMFSDTVDTALPRQNARPVRGVWCSGWRVEGGGWRVEGEGCGLQGAGCGVQGAGCGVQSAGFRV